MGHIIKASKERYTTAIVGNANIDMLMKSMDELPQWGTEAVVESYEERAGGCACNSALVLAALGDEPHIVAAVGNDHHGDALEKLLVSSGIGTGGLTRSGLGTGMSLSLNRMDGERLFVTYPGAMYATSYSDASSYIGQMNNSKAMLLTGYFLLSPALEAKKVLQLASQRGMTTLFDTGWPPSGWNEEKRRSILELLPDVDYFLPNELEALSLTGASNYKQAARELAAYCRKGIVIKCGGEGSIFVGNDGQELQASGFQVEVRDTVGAGDSFNAGFLYGLNRDWPLEACMKLGNAVAAAVISRGDGFQVKWESIDALLEGQNTKI